MSDLFHIGHSPAFLGLFAVMDNPYLVLAIVVISALSSWFQNRNKKKDQAEPWGGEDDENYNPQRSSGANTPASNPNQALNWEEELKRLLEGKPPLDSTAGAPPPPPLFAGCPRRPRRPCQSQSHASLCQRKPTGRLHAKVRPHHGRMFPSIRSQRRPNRSRTLNSRRRHINEQRSCTRPLPRGCARWTTRRRNTAIRSSLPALSGGNKAPPMLAPWWRCCVSLPLRAKPCLPRSSLLHPRHWNTSLELAVQQALRWA